MIQTIYEFAVLAQVAGFGLVIYGTALMVVQDIRRLQLIAKHSKSLTTRIMRL